MGAVRMLCIFGADRSALRGRPRAGDDPCLEAFLLRAQENRSPLDFDLSTAEARFWLRSERLRSFPRPSQSLAGLSLAASVWSYDCHALFPPSCRRRVRVLLLVMAQRRAPALATPSVLVSDILPCLIDRFDPGENSDPYYEVDAYPIDMDEDDSDSSVED